MKGTEHFKSVIKNYLDHRASYDELFAVAYAKPHKNIDHCITYIINQAYSSGCNGFADEEVFSLAMHYYDEDMITEENTRSCKVIVNHTIELTEEEQQEARQHAIQRAQNEAYAKLTAKRPKPTTKVTENQQPTLF